MKKLFILTFVVISCNTNQELDFQQISKSLESKKIEMFYNMRISYRNSDNEGNPVVYFFTKEINGNKYLLPNYKLFDCNILDKECLSKHSKKQFSVKEFAIANGIENDEQIRIFTENFVDNTINEFKKLNVNSVLSDSKIGECIIFYIDDKNYIAYVPNLNNIYNELWESKFINENMIKEKWYYGQY